MLTNYTNAPHMSFDYKDASLHGQAAVSKGVRSCDFAARRKGARLGDQLQ